MEIFIIDQIKTYLEENPSADPIEVLNNFYVVATDQTEEAFNIGREAVCKKKLCLTSKDFMSEQFNIDV